jgi:hypothetical protein
MGTFFFFAMIGAIGAVLLSLVLGLVTMVRSGEAGAKRSNKLMRWRIGLQALALLLFALAMMLSGK